MITENASGFCYDKSYMSSSYDFNTTSQDKTEVFQQGAKILLAKGFELIDIDITRPWGFFLSVNESQAEKFIREFYGGIDLKDVDTKLPLRPKFLGIAPGQRLSWQYHHRRAETWRTLAGSYGLVTSETDMETISETIGEGEVVSIPQGIRHRGVGLDGWTLVAEIWQHTDPANPSDEDDIVRVQDDFGRR
jgi:mannose-6-phosphate isomerase-like protein (cupin superfamily)